MREEAPVVAVDVDHLGVVDEAADEALRVDGVGGGGEAAEEPVGVVVAGGDSGELVCVAVVDDAGELFDGPLGRAFGAEVVEDEDGGGEGAVEEGRGAVVAVGVAGVVEEVAGGGEGAVVPRQTFWQAGYEGMIGV